jgi:hypothetical protein
MATGLEKLVRANRWRIRNGQFASTDQEGFNGHFLVPLNGELWHVIISDEFGWKHLSVTNAQRKMMPPWEIMCRLKEAFYGDDEWCVQFHPARDAYVNDHPFCLHIWRPLEDELPKPPLVFV